MKIKIDNAICTLIINYFNINFMNLCFKCLNNVKQTKKYINMF